MHRFEMGATCDDLSFLNFLICFCKVTKTRFGIILLVSIIEELKRKIGTETDHTFFSAKYLGIKYPLNVVIREAVVFRFPYIIRNGFYKASIIPEKAIYYYA